MKRRNSANYLAMSVQSKDQTGTKRIFDRYQRMPKKMAFFSHALAYAAYCDRAFKGSVTA